LPLYKRLPKLGGFVSHNRVEYAVVNVGRLNELFNDGDLITPETLEEKGAIKSALKLPVKILGDGELSKKLTVKVEKVSGSAKAKIESAGGAVE
jgi:large subunit ribosomal protein L15